MTRLPGVRAVFQARVEAAVAAAANAAGPSDSPAELCSAQPQSALLRLPWEILLQVLRRTLSPAGPRSQAAPRAHLASAAAPRSS